VTTRLGIISDIHSSLTPLRQALEIFDKHNVSQIICAGDIAGYGEDELEQVVELLQSKNCLLVRGNHDELNDNNLAEDELSSELTEFLDQLPVAISLKIENKNIFIVHAHPPDQQHGGIKLLDQHGELIDLELSNWQTKLADFNYDVLIVGHTHQVFSQQLNKTLVINPGSTLFNHSCMVLSLPEMTTDVFALGDNEIVASWNWGLFFQQAGKSKPYPKP